MLLTLFVTPAALAGCRAQVPEITERFVEDFDRAELGPAWLDTGGGYRIQDGELRAQGAYNHPLWLRRRLPRDVRVRFDVTSHSDAGDIKFELFGDGESFDPDRGGYVASGYVLIFGGWRNSLSVICRHNEHDEGVKARRGDVRVVPGQRYHFVVERRGGRIDWQIDGQPFLAWTDPEPLYGTANRFLGFGNWESDVRFDNLTIEPL